MAKCPPHEYHVACTTCARRPGKDWLGRRRHGLGCWCQDFRVICKHCRMKGPPGVRVSTDEQPLTWWQKLVLRILGKLGAGKDDH